MELSISTILGIWFFVIPVGAGMLAISVLDSFDLLSDLLFGLIILICILWDIVWIIAIKYYDKKENLSKG